MVFGARTGTRPALPHGRVAPRRDRGRAGAPRPPPAPPLRPHTRQFKLPISGVVSINLKCWTRTPRSSFERALRTGPRRTSARKILKTMATTSGGVIQSATGAKTMLGWRATVLHRTSRSMGMVIGVGCELLGGARRPAEPLRLAGDGSPHLAVTRDA